MAAADPVVILADDLTGAADTAVALGGPGGMAKVALGLSAVPLSDEAPGILSLDLHTRGMTEFDARQCMVQAGREAQASGRRIFKKMDSTWRGHVGAEVAALAAVTDPETLFVVAAAHPDLGRTVVDGRLRVHGVVADRSPLQQELEALGLVCFPMPSVASTDADEWARAWQLATQWKGRAAILCDAGSTADLRHIVKSVDTLRRRFVWVGSGGLAQAIAAVAGTHHGAAMFPSPMHPIPDLPAQGGRLFVVGSHAPIAREQVEALAAMDAVTVVDLTWAELQETGHGDPAARRSQECIRRARLVGDDVVLRPSPAISVTPANALVVSRGMATWAAPFATEATALIVCGGDTARTLLDRLGVRQLHVRPSAEMGTSLALAANFPGLPIALKAGAFGDAGLLTRLGCA